MACPIIILQVTEFELDKMSLLTVGENQDICLVTFLTQMNLSYSKSNKWIHF